MNARTWIQRGEWICMGKANTQLHFFFRINFFFLFLFFNCDQFTFSFFVIHYTKKEKKKNKTQYYFHSWLARYLIKISWIQFWGDVFLRQIPCARARAYCTQQMLLILVLHIIYCSISAQAFSPLRISNQSAKLSRVFFSLYIFLLSYRIFACVRASTFLCHWHQSKWCEMSPSSPPPPLILIILIWRDR